jgi:hypothetical protein
VQIEGVVKLDFAQDLPHAIIALPRGLSRLIAPRELSVHRRRCVVLLFRDVGPLALVASLRVSDACSGDKV